MEEQIVTTLPNLSWKTPCCGGIDAKGTENCSMIDKKWNCVCRKPPKASNFLLYMQFAQEIYSKKMHMTNKEKEWNSFANGLFQSEKKPYGRFHTFGSVKGKTLKEKFQTMCKNVEKDHGLGGNSDGYETHPEMSRYYILFALF